MNDAIYANGEGALTEMTALTQPAPVSATAHLVAAAIAYIDQLCSFNDIAHAEVHRRRLALSDAVDRYHTAQQPTPVSATEPEFPATFLFAPNSSEPKMLPAVEWLREEADTWIAFKGDEPDEPNTARTLNGIADYITTLRARLAAAERVTEEQVERACSAYHGPTRWLEMAPNLRDTLRADMHNTLTAARGGVV